MLPYCHVYDRVNCRLCTKRLGSVPSPTSISSAELPLPLPISVVMVGWWLVACIKIVKIVFILPYQVYCLFLCFFCMYGYRFLSRCFTDWRQILHGCSAWSQTGFLLFGGIAPGMAEPWASTGAIWRDMLLAETLVCVRGNPCLGYKCNRTGCRFLLKIRMLLHNLLCRCNQIFFIFFNSLHHRHWQS